MEKRTLLALAMILLVLYVSNKYIYKPMPLPEREAPKSETGVELEEEEAQEESAPPGERVIPEIEEGNSIIRTDQPETVSVVTDKYRLLFSKRGGALIEAALMEYEYFPDGTRVRLVSSEVSNFLTLILSVQKDTLNLRDVVFIADKDELDMSEERPEGNLTFTSVIGTADTVQITYTFNNDSYIISEEILLPTLNRRGEGWRIHEVLGPSFRPTEKDSVKDDFPNIGAVYMRDGEVRDVKMNSFKEEHTEYVKGPLQWVGMKNKYFIVGLIGRAVPFEGAVLWGNKEQKKLEIHPRIQLEPGERNAYIEIYIGPQDYHHLERVGLGFEKMVEYGWWIIKPFTKLVLVIMLWMHKFITNYGIVIILFSVCTKIAFYPLTKKSLKASKDMQKLQPLIKEMREKYKDEPKKLQEETMRLYKERKVNPLGGCLPLVVQMPVLWSLFYVFQRTIEFRGEEFMLWIKDLSAPDSPPVLPIVMGISMFVQQKMTPTTDPRMAPMQFVMPVVLTIIFINFPAGLVLYWTVNNIMSIAQQYHLKYSDKEVSRGGGKVGKNGERSRQRQ